MMAAQELSWQIAYGREMGRINQAGILLLSSTLQVVYLNPKGRALLQEFTLRPAPSADLPPAIRSFCQELIQMLPSSPGPTDWEELHLSCVSISPSHPILLRGFGVPVPLREGYGQILILIERAEPIDEVHGSQPAATNQIHLTPRETSVTRYLLEGFTNKEIANKLGISEHTVKDHLKRLMKKTQVTTRTAVVSRLLSDPNLLARLSNTSAPSVGQDIHNLAV